MIIGLSDIALVGLASWGVTTLIVFETGPFGVLEKIRKLHVVFTCPDCLGVWIAMIMVGLWFISPIILLPFAAVGVLRVLNDIIL